MSDLDITPGPSPALKVHPSDPLPAVEGDGLEPVPAPANSNVPDEPSEGG